MAKKKATLEYAISQVREVARQDTWSSTHANCFRCSIPPAETEEHIRKKFDRFLHWRFRKATVFVELILASGLRPDLTVCTQDGEIFHEEIAVTEKEASLHQKHSDYPFAVQVVRE